MQNPYVDLMKSSGALQASAAVRSRELWRSYFADMQRRATEGQGKARELWQSYQQELRAAGAGDDFAERIATAQSNFQSAYAEVEDKYIKASREREQDLAESLAALDAEYSQDVVASIIRYFEAIRECLPKAARERSAGNSTS